MTFKCLIGTETNPYHNLAVEQELMCHAERDTAILFLWQNENTIVIGRNQDVRSECNADKFLNEGGHIARRRSGGGAVYHDMGNLNFSIICESSCQESCKYYDIISNLLKCFNVKTEYNGRNDLIIDGKKFSGNAAYQEDRIICQHGTLLISTDIDRMVSFLTPNQRKLDRNRVRSVASRVVNLCEINREITVKSITRAFKQVTESSEFIYKPDIKMVEELTEFYKSDTWIYGGKR